MMSFRSLFSRFLANCDAIKLTITLRCGRIRDAERAALLPPATRSRHFPTTGPLRWARGCCDKACPGPDAGMVRGITEKGHVKVRRCI